MTEIKTAQLNWDEQGQPLSGIFGDVYFSRFNGLEETRHVFLQHNSLSERWQALADHSHFTIAETGFGSGLNFLATWDLWAKVASPLAQLHFVSVEKFPLHKNDLQRALALWPELQLYAEQLINAYPVIVGTGFHRLNFMGGRIKLTLIIDDATQGFTKLLASTHPLFANAGTKVDAWFLDGFAPSKNPQMWSEELFTCVRHLSKAGTTAATFSAAALVKNGLQLAGFSLQKVTGFGRKRDMIKGSFANEPATLNPDDFKYRGSFSPHPVPWTVNLNPTNFSNKSALIIGGGLAGCHTARALAERGWKVNILERHNALAQEGSGNPQGVLYAKLSPFEEAQAAFNLASLQYALNYYRPLWDIVGDKCGVLQLAHKASEVELHQQLRDKFSRVEDLVTFVDPQEASQLAGISVSQSGLFFAQAGWIDPRKLCAHLVDHPNIRINCGFSVQELCPAPSGWQVISTNGKTEKAPVVIIASAKEALSFSQASHLPIKSIRGQMTYLHQKHVQATLNTVICAEGYISPAHQGTFCSGATFNIKDEDAALRVTDHQTNLDNLHQHLPGLDIQASVEELHGRVAFRCSLPDYLPAVGALPMVDNMVRDFSLLRKNARAGITSSGSYWPGLYINIGHGARGLAYTPLCAELLAALINNEPAPMPRDLANALNPARFIIRDLIRSKR